MNSRNQIPVNRVRRAFLTLTSLALLTISTQAQVDQGAMNLTSGQERDLQLTIQTVDQRLVLSWFGSNSLVYQVESSANLTVWENAHPVLLGRGALLSVTFPFSGPRRSFFRVKRSQLGDISSARFVFGGPTPPDARIVSGDEFLALAQGEDFSLDSLTLRSENTAKARAQFQADEAEIKELATRFPAYARALAEPDSRFKLLKDGNYLTTVQGKGGPFEVVIDGKASLFSEILGSRKRFRQPSNQLKIYTYGYNALPDPLKTGLPTPVSLKGASLESLLQARRDLGRKLADNPDSISDATMVTQGPGLQDVHPDAKPPGFPATPANEEGAGLGKDKEWGGGSDFNTFDPNGLYSNFWWRQKFYHTSVKSQGGRGSCTGFALTSAVEARIAIENSRWVNLSEQYLWAKIAADWQPRWYGDGANLGNRAEDFYEQNYQLPMESVWNYNLSRSRVEDEDNETYTHSCDDYNEFCSNSSAQRKYVCATLNGMTFCGFQSPPPSGERFKATEPDTIFGPWDDVLGVPVDEMRLLLRQGHPMAAGLITTSSFRNLTAEGYIVSLVEGPEPGRHLVHVVGFISATQVQNHPTLPNFVKQYAGKSEGGYFIVKNSWGYRFGDAGYCYIPIKWAKEYFTSVTVFDVKPSAQFKGAPPNVPPTLQITAPNDSFSFPYRQPVTLQAVATDPDSSASPTITWSSDKDGLLGTGSKLEVQFDFPGTRTITAVAADANNGYASAAITITGNNLAPSARILSPSSNATFYVNDPIPFDGEGLDGDGNFADFMPCSSLSWKSSKAADLNPLFIGCEKNNVVFTNTGTRTITLTATDAQGKTGTDSVTVNIVVKPPSGPPVVNITSPTAGASFVAGSKIRLSYTLSDPGATGHSTYKVVWKLKAGSAAEKIITPETCTGTRPQTFTCFVPADYGINDNGVKISDLTLSITDPENLTGTDKVQINIGLVP